jgi:hypothetical protein
MLRQSIRHKRPGLLCQVRLPQQSQAPYCEPEHTSSSATAGSLLKNLPSFISRAAISFCFDS